MITLHNLVKTYNAGGIPVTAIDGLNLMINEGEFVCIWGKSGSGKSTLLNLLGLIDSPTSGKITIDGVSTNELTSNECSEFRSRKLGYIFQNFNLIPVLNSVENVMLPLLIKGEPERNARKKARDILEEVGLENELYRLPDNISGGQRQRVAIARALVSDPSIILADEPTANLDSATSLAIVELMKSLNREHGVTFILSTHDQDLVQHASRNIYLRDGKVYPSPIEQVSKNPDLSLIGA
ncbi:ABC transporter ATP-binding protein [Photobacterium gaetbulicola]|uniref:ABC transporter ATP-binding protein n=1 Tax=Photobacterium gaetbulicola TaxID=1295392 RepID=UPI000A48F5A5|nr:ABC transporter ATP-binding protein [Photobacterium gaetbulicola]